MGCQAPRPDNLGLKEKKGVEHKVLNPCPDSPNCIGSHYPQDEDHYLEPLKYETSKEQAQKNLESLLKKTSGAKVIKSTPEYLHVEFTSSIFRFIDDVEFNFSQDNLIHFRSASRMGHSDLGANKKRIEEITFRFYQRDF
jgi:uncharacterized protein (DUF1499 family)